MAMWEENKHPRDKSGQFTSKGNEGQGGSDKEKDARKELGKKLAAAGYDINKLKSVEETLAEYDDFDNDFEEEFLDVSEIVADNEYVYAGIKDKNQFINLLHERDNVPIDKAKEWVENNWDDFTKYYSEEEESEIDYENVEYPKGTSKEYTMVANKKYQDALPVLEKAGIKLEDFGGKASSKGGYEDNSKEIMDKYVFEPFRKKYPSGNNDAWEKEYQPLYDAIDSVLDKRYNDWWIRNRGK